MKILCNVDQAACFRYGIDAPTSTVKLEIDPQTLNPEQRNFVADNLYEGVRFPKDPALYIVPPTVEGFLAAVNYGVKVKEQGSLLGAGQSGLGLGQGIVPEMLRFVAVEAVVTQHHFSAAISTAQKEAHTTQIAKSIGEIKLGGS
jgi:hypothetical protein